MLEDAAWPLHGSHGRTQVRLWGFEPCLETSEDDEDETSMNKIQLKWVTPCPSVFFLFFLVEIVRRTS